MARFAPDIDFTLLTNAQTHELLASLDSVNVQRNLAVSVQRPATRPKPIDIAARLNKRILKQMPTGLQKYMRERYYLARAKLQQTGPMDVLRPDLIMCPFTHPYYYSPGVPLVSIIYDLQYLYYPQFFEAEERSSRAQSFSAACRVADRLICISEYVRQTVLDNSSVSEDRVLTVHLGHLQELHSVSPDRVGQVLGRLGLRTDSFMLY